MNIFIHVGNVIFYIWLAQLSSLRYKYKRITMNVWSIREIAQNALFGLGMHGEERKREETTVSENASKTVKKQLLIVFGKLGNCTTIVTTMNPYLCQRRHFFLAFPFPNGLIIRFHFRYRLCASCAWAHNAVPLGCLPCWLTSMRTMS